MLELDTLLTGFEKAGKLQELLHKCVKQGLEPNLENFSGKVVNLLDEHGVDLRP